MIGISKISFFFYNEMRFFKNLGNLSLSLSVELQLSRIKVDGDSNQNLKGAKNRRKGEVSSFVSLWSHERRVIKTSCNSNLTCGRNKLVYEETRSRGIVATPYVSLTTSVAV